MSSSPPNIPSKEHIVFDQPVDTFIISQCAQSLASTFDKGSTNVLSTD